MGGDYARHAAVVMASVWTHASRPVFFHVLHDDTLTGLNRQLLGRMAADFGRQICWHRRDSQTVRDLPHCGAFTKGSLYRLYLPRLLEGDKVLYLDCDVVCELDIAELWDAPLGGLALGAVREQGIHGWPVAVKRKVALLGLKLDEYFNSGVLAIDLRWLRDNGRDLAAEFAAFQLNHPADPFPDQDFLNWTYQSRCCLLPEKFNRMVSCLENATESATQPAILHFSGNKPWQRYENQCTAKYWQVMLKTPWRREAAKGLEVINAERERILTSSCWRLTTPYRRCGDWLKQTKLR